jgi:phage gp45-like
MRPAAENAPVSIMHTSGSKIVIDQDGNITIESKKRLDLVAEEDITLDSKKKVVVKVKEIMDVVARP